MKSLNSITKAIFDGDEAAKREVEVAARGGHKCLYSKCKGLVVYRVRQLWDRKVIHTCADHLPGSKQSEAVKALNLPDCYEVEAVYFRGKWWDRTGTGGGCEALTLETAEGVWYMTDGDLGMPVAGGHVDIVLFRDEQAASECEPSYVEVQESWNPSDWSVGVVKQAC